MIQRADCSRRARLNATVRELQMLGGAGLIRTRIERGRDLICFRIRGVPRRFVRSSAESARRDETHSSRRLGTSRGTSRISHKGSPLKKESFSAKIAVIAIVGESSSRVDDKVFPFRGNSFGERKLVGSRRAATKAQADGRRSANAETRNAENAPPRLIRNSVIRESREGYTRWRMLSREPVQPVQAYAEADTNEQRSVAQQCTHTRMGAHAAKHTERRTERQELYTSVARRRATLAR